MALDSPNEVIDPKSVPMRPTAMRYGMIGALVLIALGLVVHVAGMVDYTQRSGNWLVNVINWGVMIAVIAMGVKKHRDEELGGFITFGRGFGMGMLISLVIAVISLIWTYIFFAMIEPDLINTITEATRAQMAEQQGLDEDQIDQAMGMVGWMFNPMWLSVMAALGTLVAGAIFSLIVSAVMKKNPPPAV